MKIKIINLYSFVINFFKIKEKYKYWRVDLNLYEKKYLFINFITFYQYSIWNNGKTKIYYSLWKKGKKSVYLTKPHELEPWYIGKKEFKEKYNNNKWAIPINRVLNLNLN